MSKSESEHNNNEVKPKVRFNEKQKQCCNIEENNNTLSKEVGNVLNKGSRINE